jgi:hypothetical protein
MDNSPCSSRGQRQGAAIRVAGPDTPHGLHPERKGLLVKPDGDYMDRILGCGPADLRQSRGPLRKFSSCDVLPANLKVKVGETGWRLKVMSGGKVPGGAASGRGGMRGGRRRYEAAMEGQAVWRGTDSDALWVCNAGDAAVYRGGGEASEKGQAVWLGTEARRSATRSAGERGGGSEPSGATSVRRGQGGAKRRSWLSQGKTDTGGAEHT